MDNTSAGLKLTNEEFHSIVAFVKKSYGIDLSKKHTLIEGRLKTTLQRQGYTSFSAYFEHLKKDTTGTELPQFLNKITTNHSYFAREVSHFQFLIQTGLPYLEKTRKKELRIWSAGCSSGQEAYQLAMTFDQYFGANKSNWDTVILASDLSTNVLGKAQQAIYQEDNLGEMSQEMKDKYFTKLPDGNLQVIPRIRKEVFFRTGNLMEPLPCKKPYDIIFCRNVMIYFDKNTTQDLVSRFYDVLAPGGYLFIGQSETFDRTKLKFKTIQPSIFQK